jgi:hypothetical protein
MPYEDGPVVDGKVRSWHVEKVAGANEVSGATQGMADFLAKWVARYGV